MPRGVSTLLISLLNSGSAMLLFVLTWKRLERIFSIGVDDFTLPLLNVSLGLIWLKDCGMTIKLKSGHISNQVILTVSVTMLRNFVRAANIANPPEAPIPQLPQPPRSVRRCITRALDCEIQRQRAVTPPLASQNNNPPTTPQRSQGGNQSPDNVTPRTHRHAEMHHQNPPESPQRRRLPRAGPLHHIKMQPLERRVLPCPGIARQQLNPNVNVEHKLEPFDVK